MTEASLQPRSRPSTRPRTGVRCRASKACRRCNEKQVKCDASERGTPCTRCIQRQEPDCRLIQSRRGIYVRKPRPQSAAAAQDSAEQSSGTGDKDEAALQTSNGPGDQVPPEAPAAVAVEPTTPVSSSHGSQRQQPLTRQRQRSVGDSSGIDSSQDEASEDLVLPDVQQYPAGLGFTPDPQRSSTRSAAPPGPHFPPLTHDMPSGNLDSGNASSYRNISWAAMFNHFVEGHREGEDVLDKCSITYLGESFPLAIVLNDLKGEHAGRPLLHHPGPSCPASEQVTESRGSCHPPGMHPEELAFLEAKGAFNAPASDTLEALVDVFFDSVLPIYPIVNRQEFLEQHKSHRTPWILLHALCSVSAIFCPPHILCRAGFDSRQQARWLFYSKAKALFDVGYETNKIVLLQVAILMSFWGGGPNDNWNFYSWIGMGVTIAETIGCHRSMAGTSIRPQDRSLLKRLWWVLVVRDVSSAALIGRPFKVNLDHCDVDALSAADFEHDDVASLERPASQHTRYSILYQIHATKLTIILRRIILTRFQPRQEPSLASDSLREMLADWRNQLPPELNWSGSVGEQLNIFASTLSTMYNHSIILTHLTSGSAGLRQDDPSEAASAQSMVEEATNQAAQQIALVACSVVTRSEILLAPHELFHGVFVAAVVFYMQTKSSNQMVAQLGMSGLTNCKMVFQASRETWDPSPWFTQLFDKGLFALNPRLFDQHQASNGTGAFPHSVNGPSCVDTSMGSLFPLGYDMWQNHPVLGNLFEMAPNASPLMAMGSEFDDTSGTRWFDL